MPNGTTVSFCDGARGINPFKDFIHNQRELVVLMSTGGLLTSLTEAGSGTLAGGAHADTWAEVRRSDAAKAKAAGYLIDQADLDERTGYRLVKDEANGGQGLTALPSMVGRGAPSAPLGNRGRDCPNRVHKFRNLRLMNTATKSRQ